MSWTFNEDGHLDDRGAAGLRRRRRAGRHRPADPSRPEPARRRPARRRGRGQLRGDLPGHLGRRPRDPRGVHLPGRRRGRRSTTTPWPRSSPAGATRSWPSSAGRPGRSATSGRSLLGGALLWSIVVARAGREDERRRGDAWARRGAIATAAAAVVVVPVQAMLTSGLGLEALTTGRVLDRDPRVVGRDRGARARSGRPCWCSCCCGAGTATRDLAGVAALVLLGTFLVDGHTRTVDPAWVMWLGDAVHLLAGAAWLGGLVVLAGVVRARRREDDPVGAADVVARYSRVATWALVAVTVGRRGDVVGAGAPAPRPGRHRLRLDPAGQGRAGGRGDPRRRLQQPSARPGHHGGRRRPPAGRSTPPRRTTADAGPRPAGRASASLAWHRLGRTVRFEVAVLVAVLGVTAFLVNLRPAAEEAGITGAFDTLRGHHRHRPAAQPRRRPQPRGPATRSTCTSSTTPVGRCSDLDDVTLRADPARPRHRPHRARALRRRARPLAGRRPRPRRPRRVGRSTLVVGLDRFTEQRVEVPVVVNP